MSERLPATRERGVILDNRAQRGELVERRDPRAATSVVGYAAYGDLPQVQEWDAEEAFRLGYLANVIAFRCVQLRANAVASVPLVAGRKLGDAKTINATAEITKLLGPPPGGPAPRLSASKLFRWTMAQEIVTGRRAWEIETAPKSDKPVAFWPLASASLSAKPSKGGNEWFSAFRYGSWANPTIFKPEDVFYGWDPSGLDFRQAESGLQAARYDLTLVTLCDRYGISFLKNNAVPATIITTTKFANDDKRRAFARQWNQEFQGPSNAGRWYHNEVDDDGEGPVGDSIDVKQLGISAKDARLIDTRKEAMQELAISLGVPWSKLDASGRTFDNAEIEDRTFWEETVLPDLTDLQDDINMQLAPRFGSDVCWFDLRQVRALQSKVKPISQAVGAPALVQGRIWTINEARADYGLDPHEDGDRFLSDDEVLLFLSPASVAATATPEPAAPPSPVALPADVAEDANDDANGVNEDGTSRQAEPENRALDPEAVELRRSKIWRTADAVARGLEARWERAWRKLFTRQQEATVSRLTGKRGRQATRAAGEPIDPSAVFDVAFWAAESADLASGLYEDVVTAGLSRVSLAYGIDFDLAAPNVAEFIEARSNQLAGQVTQTTYEAIQKALVDGVEAGEGIDDIAARVKHVFSIASDMRAETIARTEVISAYNGAASMGAATLPEDVVAGQEWIATRDGRTREQHASADGQTVRIGEPFSVGGHEMAYPGDPSGGSANTVNCRCTVAFLTPEEMAEAGRVSTVKLERRHARALLMTVREGGNELDLLGFRRAAREVAA